MIQNRLEKLITFKTISGNKAEIERCFDWIESELASLHLYTKRIENNGVLSLVITTQKTKSPKIWLAAHIDVVFADEPQFIATKKGSKLFGRGAFDMKFAVACYLELLHELKGQLPALDFGIMLTSDEEVGGANGAAALVRDGYTSSVVVIPDGGTNWKFESSAKGGWWFEVRSHGVSVHASRPWLGKNAIDSLVEYLSEFKKLLPVSNLENNGFKTPTMNIGRIRGGQAINQVAEYAEAHIDIRLAYEKDRRLIEKQAKKLARKFGNIKIINRVILKSYNFNTRNKFFSKFAKIAKDMFGIKIESVKTYGSSDARFFSEKGIPVLVISPKGGEHHGVDEWIDLDDLDRYYAILKEYVLQIAT